MNGLLLKLTEWTADEKRAWLAGIIEGEGCFYARKKHGNVYGLCFELRMSDLDVVESVKTIFNSNKLMLDAKINTQTKFNNKAHNIKPQHIIRFSHFKSVILYYYIETYLHSRRRAKVEEILCQIQESKNT